MISKSRALRTNFGNLNDNFDWKIDGDQMKKNAQSVCLKRQTFQDIKDSKENEHYKHKSDKKQVFIFQSKYVRYNKKAA